MLSTLPPIKGLSHYTLPLVEDLSKNCKIDFYGFKSLYPGFLYPGGTKTNEKEPKLENLKIINSLTWYNPFSWIKVGFSIKTKIVHAQWWSWILAPVYFGVLGIARLRGKKVIMTIHNVQPHERSIIKDILNKSVLKLANEYIVHSESNKKLLSKKTNKRINVISHGLIKIKESKREHKELREKYSFTNEDKILLFFGNIRDYKGLDILLKSISEIDKKNLKLIIAGKPWKSFEKYESLISKLRLDKKIKLFLDFNPNKKVAELFKISDLVILPYKNFEASSGAGTVALNFKKPLIVTNVGGLPELVLDKKTIAQPNSPKSLKEKIIYGLSNLNKLKQDSEIKMEEFSQKNVSKKLMEVYNK